MARMVRGRSEMVEDEKKIVSFVRKGLEAQGYVVGVAHHGDEGYTLATTRPYDALVPDIMLPGRDGLSILRNVRERMMSVTARGFALLEQLMRSPGRVYTWCLRAAIRSRRWRGRRRRATWRRGTDSLAGHRRFVANICICSPTIHASSLCRGCPWFVSLLVG